MSGYSLHFTVVLLQGLCIYGFMNQFGPRSHCKDKCFNYLSAGADTESWFLHTKSEEAHLCIMDHGWDPFTKILDQHAVKTCPNHHFSKVWDFSILVVLDSGTKVGKPAHPPTPLRKKGNSRFKKFLTQEQNWKKNPATPCPLPHQRDLLQPSGMLQRLCCTPVG